MVQLKKKKKHVTLFLHNTNPKWNFCLFLGSDINCSVKIYSLNEDSEVNQLTEVAVQMWVNSVSHFLVSKSWLEFNCCEQYSLLSDESTIKHAVQLFWCKDKSHKYTTRQPATIICSPNAPFPPLINRGCKVSESSKGDYIKSPRQQKTVMCASLCTQKAACYSSEVIMISYHTQEIRGMRNVTESTGQTQEGKDRQWRSWET